MSETRWRNRTVLGIGLASLFSVWSHEVETTLNTAFPVVTDATVAEKPLHRHCASIQSKTPRQSLLDLLRPAGSIHIR